MCVILAVTSETAFLDLGGIPNLTRTYESLCELFPSNTILVATSPLNAPKADALLENKGGNYELLNCDPLQPISLLNALTPSLVRFESVLIHDASRPLVGPEQFKRVLSTFKENVDAVRPVNAFTETLKILGTGSQIKETLDRSSVKRLSTPELIRTSAIDLAGGDTGWFLPLKKSAQIENVEGTALGLRVNSPADRDLMELFLD